MADTARSVPETLECVGFASFTLDVSGRVLFGTDGQDVPLRRSEFSLLQTFLRAPGRVLSRDHLLDAVAGRLSVPYDRSVDVLVSRLRQKIEPDPKSPRLIVTVPGVGYKFTAKPKSIDPTAGRTGESVAASAGARPPPRAAERRQLTIMRCALAGSAGLSARLDPEDLQPVIALYQACCARVIGGFGGAVSRMLNDDVLAYFGYPEADEHDAEQAIRAGLAVSREVAREVVGFDERLHTRIGIASGPVVIGDVGGEVGEDVPAALGEAADLAEELVALAGPDAVVVSPGCQGLARGLFEYTAQAAPAGGPRAFRVIGERAAESRFAALREADTTPLVGREEEIAVLLRRWEQAREGSGRVVLMAGEAGIGKSRLVSELRNRIADMPHAPFVCSCAPHRRDSAYHPFTDYLERVTGFGRGDDDARRFRKLEALLRRSAAGEEAITLIADLLSVKTMVPGVDLTPRRRRERTSEALIGQVVAVAARLPVLLILEDVHWIDPSSREVLDALIDRVVELPVLLIVTFRPEFAAPWASRAHASTIVLNGLDRREAETMIEQVGGGEIPDGLSRQIIEHADGVPLFVEELARAVMEDPSAERVADGACVSVPKTLQSSVIARLDRMKEAKAVAQVGAVIGREFPHHLLAAVAELPEEALLQGLAQLVGATLVHRRGEPPDAVYSFKHALLRDATYETLLRTRRRALHGAIARELIRRSDSGEEVPPELLGHHCEQAGMAAAAARSYLEAGERSAARSALPEARAHLGRGLALTEKIPFPAERHLCQAELTLALGNVQFALHGLASREHGAALADAIALCRGLGGEDAHATKLLARALYGEWLYRLFAGQVAASHAIAQELLELGQAHTDPEIRVMSAGCLGTSGFFLGRFGEAIKAFAGLAGVSEAGAGGLPMIDFGIDARTALHRARSRLLACQGFGEQASAEARASLAKARELRHKPTIAMALAVACDTAWILRDGQALAEASIQLVELAADQGFGFWLARGKGYRGWVAAAEGQLEKGSALIIDAMAGLGGSGILLFGPHLRAMLADVHAEMGRADRGLVLLDEALEMSVGTGEAWLEAELQRRKGELLQGDQAAAESCFRRAIGIARGQTAKLFERRAVASLARLRRAGGKG